MFMMMMMMVMILVMYKVRMSLAKLTFKEDLKLTSGNQTPFVFSFKNNQLMSSPAITIPGYLYLIVYWLKVGFGLQFISSGIQGNPVNGKQDMALCLCQLHP